MAKGIEGGSTNHCEVALLTKCAEALSEKKIVDFVDSVYSY
jgi:hypothetical protein